MSEPQHPQPQDTETNVSRPAPTAVPPVGPGGLDSLAAVGARLTQLRTAKGWSIDDVSARLKVAAPKLRALEAGDVSALPDTTFALGVVRSYARMLGADPAPFTQALRREKGVSQPDLSMPASSGRDLPRGKVSLSLGNNAPRRRSWLWGIAAVVVAVIALAMWHTNSGESSAWLARLKASASGVTGGAGASNEASAAVAQGQTTGTDESASAAPATDAGSTPAATDTTATASGAGAQMPTPLPAVQAAQQAASAPAVVTTASGAAGTTSATPATAASAAVAQEGDAIVAMSVTQDSWFSVRGKDGKELFSGMVHAGETKEVTGAAPFKVTVGNKAGLESMTLDGQPVDPAKYSSARGNVARFALP